MGRPASARGLTLIEAVAGIAILGAMLAAVLVATSRLRAQDSRAARQIEACRIADRMLDELWKKPEDFPRKGTGCVPGSRDWQWRATIVPSAEAEDLNGELVAVEFFREANGKLADGNQPAVRLELVLPTVRNKEDEKSDPENQKTQAGRADAD